MKKIVVLALVLVISSAASATLTLNIVGAPYVPFLGAYEAGGFDIVEIQVVASPGTLCDVGLIIGLTGTPQNVSIANAYNNVNPGIPIIDYTGAAGYAEYETLLFADLAKCQIPIPTMPAGVVIGGIVFGCDISDGGWGRVDVHAFDPGTGIDYGTVRVEFGVPEPMTLGLLSVGGLFLRRRMNSGRSRI